MQGKIRVQINDSQGCIQVPNSSISVYIPGGIRYLAERQHMQKEKEAQERQFLNHGYRRGRLCAAI